ncbi:MAG: major facilitator superfamily 1 [Herbinix sp.]|jgi:oligosaccharide:H+ symporter|nr:major facilitator superfamily 1 [Herbinix sp.]
MEKESTKKIGLNLLLINAFIYISFSLYAPFLSSYYSKAGINAVQIGIILTIGPVVAIFVQPLWALLSDRTGRRKDILSLVVLGSAMSMFSFYIGHSFLTYFIASFLLAIFCTSIVPLSDAIILNKARKNQLDFSKIRMGGTIGFAIVVIFSGMIIKYNSDLMFIMGFIGYFLLFLSIRLLPEDNAEKLRVTDKQLEHKPKIKKRIKILDIFESKQIFFILAFAFINQMGLSFHYSFLGVYMVNLGLSEGMIGVINCVSAFSEIPVLFLINRIMKKMNTTKITILACFLLSLRIFTVTGENIMFMILSQALHGLTYMTIYYSCAVFISHNVKQENQSQGQSILAIVQTGIGSIVGNIMGGYLVDAFGLKPAYYSMSAIIIITSSAIVIIQILYQRHSKKRKEA